jgi:peptidoglycan/LPS O-acetylase OafA/YrhL
MRDGPDPAAFHSPDGRAAYRYMDAMRFFAAMAVVLGHARALVWVPPGHGDPMALWSWTFTQFASIGHQAVMVFFVLSGFWISHSTTRQLNGERFWPEFLTDRLSRLLVVVVPGLAFGVLLDLLGASVFRGVAYWGGLGLLSLADGVYDRLAPQVLVGNVLFLQGFAVRTAGTNGALWSVGFELWYYLWFAALAVSIRRRAPSPVLLALMLGVIWPVLLLSFAVWLMGSFVYHADRRWGQRATLSRNKARILLGAGVMAMVVVLVLHRLTHAKSFVSDVPLGLAFTLVLWALLRDALPFPRWLAPFARYGASASFSLYVTHYPLLVLAVSAVGYETRRNPDFASFAVIVSMCLLSVAVGWLFARVTEAHTGRLRRLIRARLQPAAKGVTTQVAGAMGPPFQTARQKRKRVHRHETQ